MPKFILGGLLLISALSPPFLVAGARGEKLSRGISTEGHCEEGSPSVQSSDSMDEHVLLQLSTVPSIPSQAPPHQAKPVAVTDQEGRSGGRNLVWINAFARTGSSLVLELVKNSLQRDSDVFALFEPCHKGDSLSPELEAKGCQALMFELSRCNFTGIDHLWGWDNSHTTNGGEPYSKEFATSICQNSSLVALKTIEFQHSVRQLIPVVKTYPNFRLISVVRDPRSAYASQRELENGMQGVFHTKGVDTMFEMCDAFAENANETSSRQFVSVYEHLVQKPMTAARSIHGFLGLPFNERHKQWVRSNFNTDCEDSGEDLNDAYSTCRSNSTASIERYKYTSELTNDDFAAFMAHKQCREVSKKYNYDLYYYRPARPQRSGLWVMLATVGIMIALILIFAGCKARYT